jgi:hypothetical protein
MENVKKVSSHDILDKLREIKVEQVGIYSWLMAF